MNHATRFFALVLPLGCITLAMTACGPSQTNSEKNAATEVRGEPISDPKPVPAAVPAVAKIETTPINEVKPAALPEVKPSASSPPPAKAPATTPAAPVKSRQTSDLQVVGFDKLASYNFDVPDDAAPLTNKVASVDQADEQIPAEVKAFNQKKVSIKGFMLPLKVQDGSVTEFLIMKDQSMCCYGNVPKITEWVSVKTTGKGVKPIMDQAVSIQGTLHVGAMRENGYLVGIYQLDGDKLIESGD